MHFWHDWSQPSSNSTAVHTASFIVASYMDGLLPEISAQIKTAVWGYRQKAVADIVEIATQIWEVKKESRMSKESMATRLMELQLQEMEDKHQAHTGTGAPAATASIMQACSHPLPNEVLVVPALPAAPAPPAPPPPATLQVAA